MIEQRTKTIEQNTETIGLDTKTIGQNTKAIEHDTKTVLTNGTLVTGMERLLTILSRRHCDPPTTNGRIRRIIGPQSLYGRNAQGRS